MNNKKNKKKSKAASEIKNKSAKGISTFLSFSFTTI